jgi:hypothetical protein
MGSLRSLWRWADPDVPSSTSYAALARYGVRRSAPVAVLATAGHLAYLLPSGNYTLAAFLVGAVAAAALGYLGGVAVALDDRGRAVLAGVASAGVLLATGAAMHVLGPSHVQDLVVGLVAFAALAPLAVGVAGYTAAERATWRATE